MTEYENSRQRIRMTEFNTKNIAKNLHPPRRRFPQGRTCTYTYSGSFRVYNKRYSIKLQPKSGCQTRRFEQKVAIVVAIVELEAYAYGLDFEVLCIGIATDGADQMLLAEQNLVDVSLLLGK